MLRERIQTALIMEDDIDWDVMIKSQMTEIARGSTFLQRSNATHSPYGDDWWVLSTGHCGTYVDINRDQEQWVIADDPTAVPVGRRDLMNGPNTAPKELAGVNTRILFTLMGLVCTGSYGISLQGASRILYDQEFGGNAQPVCQYSLVPFLPINF